MLPDTSNRCLKSRAWILSSRSRPRRTCVLLDRHRDGPTPGNALNGRRGCVEMKIIVLIATMALATTATLVFAYQHSLHTYVGPRAISANDAEFTNQENEASAFHWNRLMA